MELNNYDLMAHHQVESTGQSERDYIIMYIPESIVNAVSRIAEELKTTKTKVATAAFLQFIDTVKTEGFNHPTTTEELIPYVLQAQEKKGRLVIEFPKGILGEMDLICNDIDKKMKYTLAIYNYVFGKGETIQ
nr:MAG TPA: Proline dehydrogenase/DNA Complex, Proline, Utilization, DNA, DNA [Caudoviricetes sp.]